MGRLGGPRLRLLIADCPRGGIMWLLIADCPRGGMGDMGGYGMPCGPALLEPRGLPLGWPGWNLGGALGGGVMARRVTGSAFGAAATTNPLLSASYTVAPF
jgi:hypothetical protein